MLSYKNRFHGHGSLRYVYRNGTVTRSQYFTLKSSTNPRRREPRIAVVVSKKVLKSAVGRNRIRRRVYEVFRTQLSDLHAQLDIVCIISSAEVRRISATELREKLITQCKESHLYSDS